MSDKTQVNEEADDLEDSKMPLIEHLAELRRRLIYIVAAMFVVLIGAFYFLSEPIYQFVANPMYQALLDHAEDPSKVRMVALDPTEMFFTYIKISFIFALFTIFPLIELQVWRFVAPGLYRNERKAILPFLLATPVLFLVGAALVYYAIMPLALDFLLGFQSSGGDGGVKVDYEARMSTYVSFTLQLVFAFGLCFQLPVVMTLLARAGIVSADDMVSKRKFAVVGVFVIAAILTPPDPASQLALALPIILLYEVSIYMARLSERKRQAEEEALEKEFGGG